MRLQLSKVEEEEKKVAIHLTFDDKRILKQGYKICIEVGGLLPQ